VRVQFCGTRGSTPAPGQDFVRYGGHTSCVALSATANSLSSGTTVPTLLLDSGTGIRRVSALLDHHPFEGTILLTHLHWDHVQGLPFFESGDHPDSHVTLLLPPQEDGADAESVLARMMSPPLFPIRPRNLRGDWTFDLLPPDAFSKDGLAVGPFRVVAKDVPHKGGRTVGYRVSDGRSTIAYIPDHCPTEVSAGPDGWGEYHSSVLELARDVDVLIHDAHLLPEEVTAEASFGHAAADYAVELGRRAGARQVALFHHRPDRTDDSIDKLVDRLTSPALPVLGAADGLELAL
jgi:phosphoribosyl 1,2-cyclic phosphodiesterase